MILLYHKVDLDVKSHWYVSADQFDRQMAALQSYDVVYLDNYDPSNPRHAVITFDGIYESVGRYAAPILEKWGYPYELFVIGDHIGGDNAFDKGEPLERFATIEMLSDMSRRGARIQWHTASHGRLDHLGERLGEELDVPQTLRDVFDTCHFRWFAYPHDIGRSRDPDGIIARAVEQRFAGALAVDAGSSTDRYRFNRLTVLESTRVPGASRISIIIANYNYGRYLAESIDSVLRQTHPPDEILVIDDASSDETPGVLTAFANQVKVVVNEVNLGIVENFRKAVSLTTGDYVGFLGADNRMRSDYVERTRAALDNNSDAAVAYTDMTIFGPLAEILAAKVKAPKSPTGETYHWEFPDPTPEVVEGIDKRNFIHGSSLFRRSWYDRVGGYEKSSDAEDHDLFRRMLKAGARSVRVPHRLIEYRQHSNEQANTVLSLQLRINALERTNRELREHLAKMGIVSKSVKNQFELTKMAPNVVARPATKLNWTDDGLQIEALNNDPGIVILLPNNREKWLGVRAIYRFDQAGVAQLYTRTDDEEAFSADSQIIKPIKRGWNFLSLSIQREAPISALRFDMCDRPGKLLFHELVVFSV
ncbi:glycosyltransferase [Rhizobium sp. Root483D2]|uniref:glycosyltransferase n=1 Tax=Rhizobium sp. Root483D2 TaxID=1736545 RepID=UPI0007127713|nr:glycosyltransferase [Rhizobium sp. Root483D2]KQY45715.1 hypothetical protein ASD32_10910 [Rhizobium sp. Root483D2]